MKRIRIDDLIPPAPDYSPEQAAEELHKLADIMETANENGTSDSVLPHLRPAALALMKGAVYPTTAELLHQYHEDIKEMPAAGALEIARGELHVFMKQWYPDLTDEEAESVVAERASGGAYETTIRYMRTIALFRALEINDMKEGFCTMIDI